MATAVPILLWFAFLGIMGYLFERRTKWISRFSIFTPFFGALFLRYGIGVPFSNEVNPAETGIPIAHADLVSYYIALVVVYVGIFAGLLVSGRLPMSRGRPQPPGNLHPAVLFLTTAATLLLVVSVWIVVPWQDFKSGLLFFVSSHHTAIEYSAHRARYGAETQPSVSLLNYLAAFTRFAILPVLIWTLYFFRRLRPLSIALFCASIGVLGLVGLASGQKAPAILLLLGILFCWLIGGGRGLFSWKLVSVVGILVGIVVPVLYHVQYPSLNLPSLYQSTLYRLTGEYSRTAQLRFMFYPKVQPFLLGRSSPMVRRALGLIGVHNGGIKSPENYLPDRLAGVGYHGTWNSGFFADAWADFGFFGVAASAVLVGLLIGMIFRWYNRSPQGPLEKGTYIALCISGIFLTDVSLPTALWTYGLLSGLGVYWLLKLTAEVWKSRGAVLRDHVSHTDKHDAEERAIRADGPPRPVHRGDV